MLYFTQMKIRFDSLVWLNCIEPVDPRLLGLCFATLPAFIRYGVIRGGPESSCESCADVDELCTLQPHADARRCPWCWKNHALLLLPLVVLLVFKPSLVPYWRCFTLFQGANKSSLYYTPCIDPLLSHHTSLRLSGHCFLIPVFFLLPFFHPEGNVSFYLCSESGSYRGKGEQGMGLHAN